MVLEELTVITNLLLTIGMDNKFALIEESGRTNTSSVIEEIRNKAVPVFRKRREITRVELFGSFSKGTQNESSDIDFLIDIDDSLFNIMDIVTLQMDLNMSSTDLLISWRECIESPVLRNSIIDAPTNVVLLSLKQ